MIANKKKNQENGRMPTSHSEGPDPQSETSNEIPKQNSATNALPITLTKRCSSSTRADALGEKGEHYTGCRECLSCTCTCTSPSTLHVQNDC